MFIGLRLCNRRLLFCLYKLIAQHADFSPFRISVTLFCNRFNGSFWCMP